MFEEEEVPRAAHFEPLVLDRLSVADVRAYIVALRAEIARGEAAIVQKEAARGFADQFFRK